VLALLLLLAGSPVPAQSRQLLLATTPGWDDAQGRVRLYERAGAKATWRQVADLGTASFGRSGLAWGRGLHPGGLAGPLKKEGDGRSPAGVFHLRGAAGHAAERPGLRIPYRPATDRLRCVDDPASRAYNRWVIEGEVEKDWSSAEEMRRKDDLYRWTVWVAHNDDPVVPGGGSCIFLHLRAASTSTTSGCTAFDADALERILEWLDAGARPVLVQVPEPVLRRVARPWGLPRP
jgi:D-alanyl-D-alanine dipeptidase